MSATPRRGVRVPAALWNKALETARRNNTTVTAIVVRALENYTQEEASE